MTASSMHAITKNLFRRPFVKVFAIGALALLFDAGCDDRVADDLEAAGSALPVLKGKIEAAIRETEHDVTFLAARLAAAYPAARNRGAPSTEYALADNGVLYRPLAVDRDVPAVFVSGVVPVDEEVLRIVEGTEVVDPLLKELVLSNEEVTQAYYNDRNSYNRIYPPFDVLTQYPAGMNIPSYNFYYLADEKNNPERNTVWIREPYVDPAGRGWMISCVAPVYWNGKLEGVCGLDITIESIVRSLGLEEANSLAFIVAEDGSLVAAGESIVRVLRLPPLKNHRYVDTVRSDTFRPENYNLLRSSSPEIRASFQALLGSGVDATTLLLDNREWVIRGVEVEGLGWKILQMSLGR